MSSRPRSWIAPIVKLTADQASYPCDRVFGVLGRGDGAPRRGGQRSAGFGQLDVTGAAHEELTAQLAFEQSDRAGQA